MSVNVNTSTNTITIQQDGTRVIQVNTLGPQGQQGLQGIQGDSIFTNISGSIWATTSSLQISNSLDLSGSLIAPKITGSLLGTSSWAENALTSSFITTAQTASYILQAVSASFAILAETANTASYIITAQTASYVLNAISSSFASTASYLNILNQNLIITGSTDITGSSFTWNNNQILTTPSTTTGTVVSFTSNQVYNEWDVPGTGNITDDLTGAKTGIVQKIYHNNSIAPSVPAGWVVVSNGVYVPNILNIIYAEWVKGTRVEYWITQ